MHQRMDLTSSHRVCFKAYVLVLATVPASTIWTLVQVHLLSLYNCTYCSKYFTIRSLDCEAAVLVQHLSPGCPLWKIIEASFHARSRGCSHLVTTESVQQTNLGNHQTDSKFCLQFFLITFIPWQIHNCWWQQTNIGKSSDQNLSCSFSIDWFEYKSISNCKKFSNKKQTKGFPHSTRCLLIWKLKSESVQTWLVWIFHETDRP